jgi:hypothetical protein
VAGRRLAGRDRPWSGGRIFEQAAQHGHGVFQRLAIGVIQAGELGLDRAGAIGPDPVKRL